MSERYDDRVEVEDVDMAYTTADMCVAAVKVKLGESAVSMEEIQEAIKSTIDDDYSVEDVQVVNVHTEGHIVLTVSFKSIPLTNSAKVDMLRSIRMGHVHEGELTEELITILGADNIAHEVEEHKKYHAATKCSNQYLTKCNSKTEVYHDESSVRENCKACPHRPHSIKSCSVIAHLLMKSNEELLEWVLPEWTEEEIEDWKEW